jgi:hypothetical protein
MADSDSYPKKYPSSHRGERIETRVGDLADMNQNKGVLDSGPRPHINPDDTGRYERKDHRTRESKREKPTVLYRANPRRKPERRDGHYLCFRRSMASSTDLSASF